MSGLPLHCSCVLGWGGMSLEWGWQSSGSHTSMFKIPWSLCCCGLTGLQSHPRAANWRSTPWVAESPIYCFCPQVPFLGLLEALLWCSSEQAAFGWSMRSPLPTAALPTACCLLFSFPWLPWCTAGEWLSGVLSQWLTNSEKKSHWDGADSSEGSGLGRRNQSSWRKRDGKNENIWGKTILSELFLL